MFGRPLTTLRRKIAVRLVAPALDSEIAAGGVADRDLLVERSRVLLATCMRTGLADTLDRIVEMGPTVGPDLGPPRPDRGAVREARALLLSIALRLRDEDPLPDVRGIAMLTCLLRDPDAPLYAPGSGPALCRRAAAILTALG